MRFADASASWPPGNTADVTRHAAYSSIDRPRTHSSSAPPGDPAMVLIAPFGLASWFDPGVDQPNEPNTTVAARTPAIVYTTPLAAHPACPSLTRPGCSATTCAVGFGIDVRLDMRGTSPALASRMSPAAKRTSPAGTTRTALAASEVFGRREPGRPGSPAPPGASASLDPPHGRPQQGTTTTLIITTVLGASLSVGAAVAMAVRRWPRLGSPQFRYRRIARAGVQAPAAGPGPARRRHTGADRRTGPRRGDHRADRGSRRRRHPAADDPHQQRLRPSGSSAGRVRGPPCHRRQHVGHAHDQPARRNGRDHRGRPRRGRHRVSADTVTVRRRVPGDGRRRSVPRLEPREVVRRSRPAGHRPAHRLRRHLVPVRPRHRGGRHLRRLRAAARARPIGRRQGAARGRRGRRSRSPSRRPGCSSGCTGSPTWSADSPSGGRGSRSVRSCSVAGGCTSGPRSRQPSRSRPPCQHRCRRSRPR